MKLFRRLIFAALPAVMQVVVVATSHAELFLCRRDAAQITAALTQLESSVDACGQSLKFGALLEELQRCRNATYEICTDRHAPRNLFDRPEKDSSTRTIHWNPKLHSELELGCDGDMDQPVYREPTASLLHEIVHAVQDCRGLNPGEHEIEAVAIENMYRRAAGLCQRSNYGSQPLPLSVWLPRTAGSCDEATQAGSWKRWIQTTERSPATTNRRSGDQPD